MKTEDTEKNPLEKGKRADISIDINDSYHTYYLPIRIRRIILWGGFLG